MFSASKTSGSVYSSGVAGEAIFTASTSWTVPAGVTSVSVVCIGAGGGGAENGSGGSGGGGGDLRYYNNLSVTPGESLTITVGAGGTAGSSGTAGGFSRVARGGTTLLEAAGGGGGTVDGSGAKNGTSSTIAGSIGGGDGGTSPNTASTTCGGGGGAGGYSGNGGNGGNSSNDGANGAANSGAGGGGGAGGDGDASGAGGGVNVFGIGTTGIGGVTTTVNGSSATGGSYGDGGLSNNTSGGQSYLGISNFGGGATGADNTTEGGEGGQGAVRIVWPGISNSFPSTNVWMSSVLTTVIETQSSTSGSITIPASAQAGDLAVLMNAHETIASQSNPTGWTRIVNQEAAVPTMTIWYRILQSGDANTAVTMTGGVNPSSEMILFRKSSGTISSVTVSGATIVNSTTAVTSQTQNVSTATATFIAFGAFGSSSNVLNSSDMYFTGGSAGTGNAEPAAVFTGTNGDASRQAFMRFRIYDTAPATNLSVVNRRDTGNQTMASFIIQVS